VHASELIVRRLPQGDAVVLGKLNRIRGGGAPRIHETDETGPSRDEPLGALRVVAEGGVSAEAEVVDEEDAAGARGRRAVTLGGAFS
jgi:hypothetical protein